MSAITTVPLLLSDAVTTTTFTPISITGDKATFKGDDGAISAARSTLEASLSTARASRSSDQVNFRINKPLARVDPVTSDTSVVGTGFVKMQFVLPDIMTDLERADLHEMARKSLSDALLKAYVVSLNPAY